MNNKRMMQALCFAIVVVWLAAGMAAAQVSTSTIGGTVTDAQGLVVVGAKVVAKNEATTVSYQTETTTGGTYSLSSLPPGLYTITVTQQGFKTFTSTKNVLTVGAPLVVDAQLVLGEVTEVVQVESSFQRLETSSAMLGGVVSGKEIQELPLNGRNPLNLIILEPGLVQRTTNAAGSGTHVFGSRDRAHNVTIDGIDANESSVPNPQSNIYRLTPENTQEYRVVTHNATPEFGRNSGANVIISTRQGSNEFHGDVFWYHRNSVLNANEFYNKAQGVERPTLLLNQYGVDIGGPIFKNKTFFFFSYQGNSIKQTQPIAQSFGVPLTYTQLARQGIFRFVRGSIIVGGTAVNQNSTLLVDSSGNLRPGVPVCGGAVTTNCVDSYNMFSNDPAGIGADANMVAMINSFPLPNSFSDGDGLNTGGFVWNTPSRFKGPFYRGRVDHKFNDSHNLSGVFTWTKYDTSEGDLLNSRPATFPGFPPQGEVNRASQLLSVSYRTVFSPQLVNEFTTGYSRFHFFFSLLESQLARGVTPPPFGQECFGTDSLSNVDTPFCNTPHTERAVSNVQFIDNLSYGRGTHNFRVGFNIRLYRHNDSRGVPGGFNMSPTMIFSRSVRSPSANTAPGVAAGFTIPSGMNSTDSNRLLQTIVELVGIPARVQQAFQADLGADVYRPDLFVLGTRSKQYNVYVQDEWKWKRNFTVTYGLRWEWNRPGKDCCNRTFRPDRPIDGSEGLVQFTQSDSWWDRNNSNAIAPRVSFAWDPWSDGKTVVRAGYGVAFDTISTFQITSIAGKVPGSVLQCVVNVQDAAGVCGDLPNNVRVPQLLAALNPFTLPTPAVTPSSQFSPAPAALGVAPSVGAFQPDLRMPTVHEWNLTTQRELPWGFVAQVGYIGKRGTRLFRAYNLNQINTDQSGFRAAFLAARQNLVNGCRADGTNCPAGATGVTPTLLLTLTNSTLGSATSFLNSSTTAGELRQNGVGDFAVRIDQATRVVSGVTLPLVKAQGFAANYFRPNPQFSEIFYFDSGGSSTYHGLIAQVVRRFQKSLTMGFAYTLSKSIDDMSVDPVAATSGGGLSTTNSRTPTDVRNFRLDRARSDFDNRHVISANYLYELPFGKGRRWSNSVPGFVNHIIGGWTMTGIFTYQSGEPFTLNSGARTVHNTKVSRAQIRGPFVEPQLFSIDGVQGPVVWRTGPLITTLTDPNVNCRNILTPDGTATQTYFCIPGVGETGSARNFAQGPSFWNFNFGVLKNFAITEKVKLDFRAEFFNLFNHPNFENPRNASVGSPTLTSGVFGQTCCITSSVPASATVIANGEPNRVIQFAFKVSF